MRLSSSLQDISKYSRVDPEEGHVILETGKSYGRLKPAHPLLGESGGSSFSKEKSLPATSFMHKKQFRAVVCVFCFLFMFASIYICSRYLSAYWSQNASQYYVILDCGSTGTRVYVYEWTVDQKKGGVNLPIALKSLPDGFQRKSRSRSGRAYQRMESEPGFDKLVRNESGLQAAIKPLIHWAEKQIPKHAHKSTSLFLYATAGVRRLPNADSEWLLSKAWSILRNSLFMCERDRVKIISGMEEAFYGWIALNYHMGVLGFNPAKETFGALDLGGSSLQVTFETTEVINDQTSLNLSIGAVNHHLSAYSLSGYGLNDAFDKSVVYLIKNVLETYREDLRHGKVEVKHPCLHTGYKEMYTCSQCAMLNQEGSPLIGGGNMVKGQPGIAVELIGAPEWNKCSALAKKTVNLSEWSNFSPGLDCGLHPCALGNSLPRPHGQFYAMSGFFVVFRFFNLTSEATLSDIIHKGQEFCEKTWEVARSSVVPQPFIEQYCFRAPYIVSLLRDGLHIMDNQVNIGSGSITWTLGVALLEAGQTLSSRIEFHGYRIFQTRLNWTTFLVMLLLSAVVLFCALSFACKRIPRLFHRSYLPLFGYNNAASNSVLSISSPFSFRHWSPISLGDPRVKTPLSPTVSGSQRHHFSMGQGLGTRSVQLMDSSLHPSGVAVSHSYSSGSLGQMQLDNGVASFMTPHWSQMRLQSRRSQSREDLSSSLPDSHLVKG